MSSLRKIAVFAVVVPAALCGTIALRKGPDSTGSIPASIIAPRGDEQSKPRILSAGRTRVFRAGVFQMATLDLPDLAAGPLDSTAPAPGLVMPASLNFQPEEEVEPEMPVEAEIPGDPIRDGLKSGAESWPSVEHAHKGDPWKPGTAPETSFAVPLAPGVAGNLGTMDPLFPTDPAPALGRLSRLLEPPETGRGIDEFRRSRIDAELAASMAERLRPITPSGIVALQGGDDGAVPLDHSLDPAGGTSPAASRPDLASLDQRITTLDGDKPLELAAAQPDVEPVITLASVRPTEEEAPRAMPEIGPDEGLTTAQKNTRIAGLPGLDDGLARPLTLPPVAFTRSQKCLATAIYFEARSESREGQIGVAQVIVNRVRSPFYPKNVCDVVYQGASERRYGGCQFSFACDRIPDRVTDTASWDNAMVLAQKVLDAEEWIPEIGNATHYHANYVRPRWVRDMVQKDRIGRHIFYRVKWWA